MVVIRVGDGIPSTVTSARIKAVLALAKSHERILKKTLDAYASPSWMATGLEGDFYKRLVALIATVEGRRAYQEATSDFENQKPKWLGRADLFRRLFEDCVKTTQNLSNSANPGSEFDSDLIQGLAEAGSWANLAEVTWAKSVIEGNACYLLNALTKYPNILTYLEAVEAGLIQDKENDIRLELEEEGEATQLVGQVKRLASQLDANQLNANELLRFSQLVKRLTEIAEIRSHRDRTRSMLQAQIERWEQSHTEGLKKENSVAPFLAALKTLVDRGAASQTTVAAILDHAGTLLSIEARFKETQAKLVQASTDENFATVRIHVDALESLSAERDAARQAFDALLDEPKLGDSYPLSPNAEGTRTNLDSPTARPQNRIREPFTPTVPTNRHAQDLAEEFQDPDSNQTSPTDDCLNSSRVSQTRHEDTGSSEDGDKTALLLGYDESGTSLDANEAIKVAIKGHNFGIAYHLALTVPDASPSASTIKLVACNFVTDKSVPLRTELSDLAGTLLNRVKVIDDGTTNQQGWRDEVVLTTCAALVPALEVPGGLVAQLLSAIEPHLGELPSLRTLARVAAQVSMTGVDLPVSSLREDDTVDMWRERETALRAETKGWFKNELRSTIKYHAATRVWRRMLEDWNYVGRSSLGHLFALLDKPAEKIDLQLVLDITEYWRANREKEIDRIDRENRKWASNKKIEGSARLDLKGKVDQALALSERWHSLIIERPDKRPAFPMEQAKLLRSAVNEHAQQALAEISKATTRFGSSASELLQHYRNLFIAPKGKDNLRQLSLTDLLHAELLADPSIEFDSTGVVVSSPLDPVALQDLLSQNKLDFSEPAVERARRGDFRGAETTLNYAERIGRIDDRKADQTRNRIDFERSRAQQNLEHKIRETIDRLDAAYAAGALTLETFERLCAEIPDPDGVEADAFTRLVTSLEKIDDEIRGAQTGRRDALSRSLHTLRQLSQGNKSRVEQAINDGLFQVAEDFIERIERGEQLPDPDAVTNHPFDQFFPDFVEMYAGITGNGTGRIEKFRELVEAGGLPDIIDARGLSEDARRDAIGVVDAWVALRDNRTSISSLSNFMKAIGFGDAKIKGSNEKTRAGETVFQLQTAPINDRYVAKLPDFGSGANGRYRVFAIRGRVTEESIV
ncbi:MAG: hypothetical protein OXT74_10030, partial [Candidatus Poribacteria bacterium]|nr:hypothetical protein [Candidatus Poribacteria bacterium]